jgi:hypothetical protein
MWRGAENGDPNDHLPSGYLTKPWKITMLLIGKPSISMGHLYHGYVTNKQRVNMT